MSKKITLPNRPSVLVQELAVFDATDLAGVRRAFAAAPPMVSQQAWLPKPDEQFSPMTVRAGWNGEDLIIFAELTDADIFTRATERNQRFWELGDVFEIFLRPVGQETYVELQVAPNNLHLQLRYPDAAAAMYARQAGLELEFILHGQAFRSQTWIQPEEGKWFVFAEIPIRLVSDDNQPLAGGELEFSFSRYDYTRGQDRPVISSTSPLETPDFHRQQDWGTLRFISSMDGPPNSNAQPDLANKTHAQPHRTCAITG